jgi:hypothetical protein
MEGDIVLISNENFRSHDRDVCNAIITGGGVQVR